MTDTTPSATLAAIRERSRLASELWDAETIRRSPTASAVADSAMDMPLVVAALERVLALAGPEPTDPDPYPEHPMIRLVRCDVLREAITAALTWTPQPSEDENHGETE